MSALVCPKCRRSLQKVSEGKVVSDIKPGQSIDEVAGEEWETYTCQNKNCEYYNKTLIWNRSKNEWKKLPSEIRFESPSKSEISL